MGCVVCRRCKSEFRTLEIDYRLVSDGVNLGRPTQVDRRESVRVGQEDAFPFQHCEEKGDTALTASPIQVVTLASSEAQLCLFLFSPAQDRHIER